MNGQNSLSIVTSKLTPFGQQRLFEFLDVVDTETAARFRGWLASASEEETNEAAGVLNRAGHGREFAGWWRNRDRPETTHITPQPGRARSRSPFEHLHSQARARSANNDLTVGGMWFIGGLLVTIISYSLAASTPGGGHYLIASGAMLFGLLRIFRGLKGG
jgi:hypothetical protein